MATSWLLSERSSLRNASRIPLLDIVKCSLQGEPPPHRAGRRNARTAAAETDGAATDPTRRIRRSTPASRHARATPVSPRAGPARQRPFADSSEPYRSHRARNLSTDGSVSSCRMPLSRSSAYISRPGLAGPADVVESGREAGRLRCAPGEDPAAAHIRCVPCLCRRWELVGVDDVRGSLCESPPAARRLRTTAGRRVTVRAVIRWLRQPAPGSSMAGRKGGQVTAFPAPRTAVL